MRASKQTVSPSPAAEGRPVLVLVIYANPDGYPPTFNAVQLLRDRFAVRIVCRNTQQRMVSWPDDVVVERVGNPRAVPTSSDVSRLGKLREYLDFVGAVRRTLTKARPHVVYAYEPHALVALALAGCRAPIVYQRHEVEELESLGHRSLGDWIVRASLHLSPKAAQVVFPEKHRAAYYGRFVKDERQPLITPNYPLRDGIAPPLDWSALIEERWRTREIFYRGAIGPGTGVRDVLRALPLLGPDATFRYCGVVAPDFQKDLQALAEELGVAHRVRYGGFIPTYEGINEETQKATVGVSLYRAQTTNSSFTATAANKIFEYAACGLPVILPERPSFREAFAGETWIEFAEPEDPASIARAVQRLLASPERYSEACRAARRAVDERFNYEAAFAPVLEATVRLGVRHSAPHSSG